MFFDFESPSLISCIWFSHIEMSITAEESMILPCLTFLLELFGVFASPSQLTVPDTVIVSPCFLFLMTSA